MTAKARKGEKRGEGGQEEARREESGETKKTRGDRRFSPAPSPSSPCLFEMLQKITGSGMEGCTVGGQERRKTEREEKKKRQTRLTQQ